MKIQKEVRPWGEFEQFCLNTKCTVKTLKINPSQELSKQKHKNRDEFWEIIEGVGYIFLNDEWFKTKEGDSFFIKRDTVHSLMADPDVKIKVLEISFGTFDEKDEVRLSDKYNR